MIDPFLGLVNRRERYVDVITGQPLSPELYRIARTKEVDHFFSNGGVGYATRAGSLVENGAPTHQCWMGGG